VVNGLTCKEVARKLGISHRTVEVHRARLMKKLQARNSAELVSRIIVLRE
jgi:DNA-binding CsgD family transcriptional regulator